MKFEIRISPKIGEICPTFRAGIIYADVTNNDYNDLLWNEIAKECEFLKQKT